MKRRIFAFCCLLMLSSFFLSVSANNNPVNWEKFLSKHDLVLSPIGKDYYSSALLGNGLLGTAIYMHNEQSVQFDIGRTDVTDNRGWGPELLNLFNNARLPLGKFMLTPVGKITHSQIHLSLWNAEANSVIETDKGTLQIKAYVHATRNVIIVEVSTTGGENNFVWQWQADKAISPRANPVFSWYNKPKEYLDNPNPPSKEYNTNGYNICEQILNCGRSYATAWKEEKKQNTRRFWITVENNISKTPEGAVATQAIQQLQKHILVSKTVLENTHRDWWHKYYPASFLTIPDKRMEGFYWMQQYKLAAATRPQTNILDLMGPWAAPTPWPAVWWNLNVQLTYSPVFTANRQEFSKPIWNAFYKYRTNLYNNVMNPEWMKDAAALGRTSSYDLVSPLNPALADANQYEVGNLTWMMYYYWQYCTYTANKTELLQKFYPLLRRSIQYYLYIVYKGEDGYFHLPKTASPEYMPAKDCNYDLSLLRWGLQTLLQVNKTYNIKDSLQNKWQLVLNKLAPYPADDKQGLLIGEGVPLASSHRHYSHMLMIYPLYLMNWEQPGNHDLIEKSLYHWISQKEQLQGYSYTGAASIFAMMNKGDSAYAYLNNLLDKFIQINTLYKESGPVIETPLAAAASLQEMLLQSWGGVIRVFPAIPSQWQDCSFKKFRTPGAFLISADYAKGKTATINIFSEAGGECVIQTGIEASNIVCKHAYKIIDANKGIINLQLAKGVTVVVKNKEAV